MLYTHTHTQLEYTLRKTFLNHNQRAIWWNDGSCICSLVESPSLELNFCCPSLNLSCGDFPGTAQLPYPQYWRFLAFYPKCFLFYLCCSFSWSICLVRKPGKCSTFLIPGSISHTFTPLWKPERPGFTPDRVTQGVSGRWPVSASPSQRQAYYSNLDSYQSDGQGSQLVPEPSPGSLVQLRLALRCARRGKSLCWINRSSGTWWEALLMSQGCWAPVTRRQKHCLLWVSINVTGISNRDMGHQGFSGSSIY
jgi:hypothetical protein